MGRRLAAPLPIMWNATTSRCTRAGRGAASAALIAFAEETAREHSVSELRLYTHVIMTENIARYARIGFVETHRGTDEGYESVFMRKLLAVATS
jgi:hypothetical protein